MSKFRRQLMTASILEPVPPTPVLPYDAEVEWLQGDGNAYLSLPFEGYSNKTTFELDIIAVNNNQETLLGSRKTTSERFCWVTNPYSNQVQVGYGSKYNNISLSITNGDVVRISSSISNGNIIYKAENITTSSSKTQSYALSSFNVLSYIYLLWSGSLNKSHSKILKGTIYNDGGAVLDFIPVRKSGIGYLYDKISGQLFGNIGTGNFIIGNDKN